MKTVNLLPDWYVVQQRQHGRLRLHLMIMILMGVTFVGAMGISRTRLALADRHLADLQKEAKDVGNPEVQLRARLAELDRLKNLKSAYRELGNTIPMSAVVQQVQNDMSQGMALSRVTIDVHPDPLKGSSFVGAKTPPRLREVAHLTVVGIASNDLQIGQMIGKISQNPLFSDVSLNYTRTEILHEYSVRRFEIQMQMDLEPLSAEDPEPATMPASLVQGEPADAR